MDLRRALILASEAVDWSLTGEGERGDLLAPPKGEDRGWKNADSADEEESGRTRLVFGACTVGPSGWAQQIRSLLRRCYGTGPSME